MTFTPVESLIGGLLIGASCAAYLQFQGRITGISGIVSTVIKGYLPQQLSNHQFDSMNKEDWKQKLNYVIGLILAGAVCYYLDLGGVSVTNFLAVKFSFVSALLFIIGGMLVGFGTQLGSGCTSGHMICGIARLSKRSFVATLTFCGVAMILVNFFGTAQFMSSLTTNLTNPTNPIITNPTSHHHTITTKEILQQSNSLDNMNDNNLITPFLSLPSLDKTIQLIVLFIGLISIYTLITFSHQTLASDVKKFLDKYLTLYHGFVFGIGLSLSGMTNPMKVLGFFDFFGKNFDPSLMCVALGAILPDLILFQYFILPNANHVSSTAGKGGNSASNSYSASNNCASSNSSVCDGKPFISSRFHLPPGAGEVDWKLIVGSLCFGLGWGLLGICPGPFVTNLSTLNVMFVFYGIGFVNGCILKFYFFDKPKSNLLK